MAAAKVVFLDRDGTINVDRDYVHRVSDWKFADGAPAALKKLRNAGYQLAIVTNQSGIGRGYYTLEDMNTVHEHMRKELHEHGVTIDALAFCAHDPDDNCGCRKPATGMAKQIEEQIGEINYAASWSVGDREKDIQFGTNIGVATALLKSRHWNPANLSVTPDLVVSSLWDFAVQIS